MDPLGIDVNLNGLPDEMEVELTEEEIRELETEEGIDFLRAIDEGLITS